MEELIYTSAPQGLRSRTGGFCTVEMTEGMSPELCDALEALSAYDHHPAGTINWMHLRVPTIDGLRHVVSRVSAAEGDYSGRSNMLAHHVCIAPAEALPPLTPAALLSPGGPLRDKWSGQVRRLPPLPCPAITSEPVSAGACHLWEVAVGDAGAAGGVLSKLPLGVAGPLWLIRTPAMDALAMTLELLALLPPSQQWDVTFCTYLHALARSVECRLRWVLADSPAHQSVRHLGSDQLIDLRQGCDALLAAADPMMVNAARSGTVIDVAAASSHSSDIFLSGPMIDVGRFAGGTSMQPADGLPTIDLKSATDASRRKSSLAWWTMGAVAIIIICTIALITWLIRTTLADALTPSDVL